MNTSDAASLTSFNDFFQLVLDYDFGGFTLRESYRTRFGLHVDEPLETNPLYKVFGVWLWEAEIPLLVDQIWGENPKPDWLVAEQDRIADAMAAMHEAREELNVRLMPYTGTALDEINHERGTEAYMRSQGFLK